MTDKTNTENYDISNCAYGKRKGGAGADKDTPNECYACHIGYNHKSKVPTEINCEAKTVLGFKAKADASGFEEKKCSEYN